MITDMDADADGRVALDPGGYFNFLQRVDYYDISSALPIFLKYLGFI